MLLLGYQFSLNSRIESLLVQIKEQERKLGALSISAEFFQKIFRHNYLQQAYSSTKIEYSLINYNTAQKVLFHKKAKNEQEGEVLNAANAHLAVLSHLKEPISNDLIIEVHRQISENLKGSWTEPDYRAGRYRTIQNYLGDPFSDHISFTFPGPREVPSLMRELNQFANGRTKINPLLIPGIFHFVFIAIHPFVNGNGRTIRVLEDFFLKKAGYNLQTLYNLSQYYYANLKNYHFYLNRGREQRDLTDFIEFYLQGILECQQNVFKTELLLERMERLHDLPSWGKMDKLDRKMLTYLAGNNELSIKKALKLCSKKLSAEALRLRFQNYIQWGFMKKLGTFKDANYIWES
ncbi:MAG: Fic family protein [Candidatus Gracilibacteria bacterium]